MASNRSIAACSVDSLAASFSRSPWYLAEINGESFLPFPVVVGPMVELDTLQNQEDLTLIFGTSLLVSCLFLYLFLPLAGALIGKFLNSELAAILGYSVLGLSFVLTGIFSCLFCLVFGLVFGILYFLSCMVCPLKIQKDEQTFLKVETLVPETGLKKTKSVQLSAGREEEVTAENVLQHIPAVMANSLLLAETMFDQSTSAAASMIRFPLITVPKKLARSIFGFPSK